MKINRGISLFYENIESREFAEPLIMELPLEVETSSPPVQIKVIAGENIRFRSSLDPNVDEEWNCIFMGTPDSQDVTFSGFERLSSRDYHVVFNPSDGEVIINRNQRRLSFYIFEDKNYDGR